MDVVLLGFLFLLTLVFIFYGLFRANPLALLSGGMFLVLFSGLVHVVGYDIDYNPVDSISVSTYSYDTNELLNTANVQVFQVNGANSITVYWLSLLGMLVGGLLSLFSVLGLVSRSGR